MGANRVSWFDLSEPDKDPLYSYVVRVAFGQGAIPNELVARRAGVPTDTRGMNE
jgi:hypothetical protein